MFRFFQKISKQVNKLNTFVNDYKSVAKEVSLPSYAYVNWGAQLAESGNEKDALEKFEQSAQMVNSTPEAFVNLGIIFARKGEFEQAIKYFKKALKIDDTYAKAWALLASAYSEVDEVKEAKKAFKSARIKFVSTPNTSPVDFISGASAGSILLSFWNENTGILTHTRFDLR